MFDISIFKHGSEAFGSKLQFFNGSFVLQFPKETQIPGARRHGLLQIQRKQHEIWMFDLKTSEPC